MSAASRPLGGSSLKFILRLRAVIIGTAYFCSTVFLVFGAPRMSGVGEFFGYFSAALAQFVVGVTLVGIGLGLWRIAR
jgi:hypothetical protein